MKLDLQINHGGVLWQSAQTVVDIDPTTIEGHRYSRTSSGFREEILDVSMSKPKVELEVQIAGNNVKGEVQLIIVGDKHNINVEGKEVSVSGNIYVSLPQED